jgi:very-short-patch-repair endonuclease
LKWKRQVPLGPFIVDFLCREAGLVLEIDGEVHAAREAYDARRTTYLESLGLRVMRFTNEEVTTDRAAVCGQILAACAPSPPTATGGREGEGRGEGGAGPRTAAAVPP